MKIKQQSQEQISWVFGQPLSFGSNATISYSSIPDGFECLEISPDRGGGNSFSCITISCFGDDEKRVLGVRVFENSSLLKEDLYEFDRSMMIRKAFPKGEYQKVNNLYEHTHYTYIN
jgi:hypothetical protein